MSRTTGALNWKPTKARQSEMYKLLRRRAELGDADAIGWLLWLCKDRENAKAING